MQNSSRERISIALFTLITADLKITANTHGTTTIDGISERDFQGLYFGEQISGPGIVDGTIITDLSIQGTIIVSVPTTTSVTHVVLAAHTFKTAVRKLISPVDVATEQRPFLCLWEPDEIQRRPLGPTSPPEKTLNFLAFIYVSTKVSLEIGGPPPMSLLNPIVDAIELSLSPNLLTMTQSLGTNDAGSPLCVDCFIEGTIDKRGGDLDGQGIAIIPIKVLVPW